MNNTTIIIIATKNKTTKAKHIRSLNVRHAFRRFTMCKFHCIHDDDDYYYYDYCYYSVSFMFLSQFKINKEEICVCLLKYTHITFFCVPMNRFVARYSCHVLSYILSLFHHTQFTKHITIHCGKYIGICIEQKFISKNRLLS